MIPFDKSDDNGSDTLFLFDERSKSQEHKNRLCINEKTQKSKENEENGS